MVVDLIKLLLGILEVFLIVWGLSLVVIVEIELKIVIVMIEKRVIKKFDVEV